MKRDTELWLLVREIRSEYRKLSAMMAKWGYQLEDAENKLRAILDDPDAQASKEEPMAWDEQTR